MVASYFWELEHVCYYVAIYLVIYLLVDMLVISTLLLLLQEL